jgi:NAD-dependent DNA ligase
VAGTDAGSKLDKAKELGVAVIDEKEMEKLAG